MTSKSQKYTKATIPMCENPEIQGPDFHTETCNLPIARIYPAEETNERLGLMITEEEFESVKQHQHTGWKLAQIMTGHNDKNVVSINALNELVKELDEKVWELEQKANNNRKWVREMKKVRATNDWRGRELERMDGVRKADNNAYDKINEKLEKWQEWGKMMGRGNCVVCNDICGSGIWGDGFPDENSYCEDCEPGEAKDVK
jgi:hypothetical protein|tara:strand:+ start:407 stop:1012 length:606 start_codon:yes stop_codon:yes gene_type:complete